MNFYDRASNYIKKWEGFSSKAHWDVNDWRIGHGSNTITLPDGTYREVKRTDTTTKELAGKDLARRIKQDFEPKVKKQLGAYYYDKLPDSTKIALLSLAYNYGSITKKPIIEAVKKGNVNEIAEAIVDSTKYDNIGKSFYNALRVRRKDEANFAKSDLTGGYKETDINTYKVAEKSNTFVTVLSISVFIFAGYNIYNYFKNK